MAFELSSFKVFVSVNCGLGSMVYFNLGICFFTSFTIQIVDFSCDLSPKIPSSTYFLFQCKASQQEKYTPLMAQEHAAMAE